MSTTTKKITELGEQEVPLYATDLAVVVTNVSTSPATKKTTLGTLRRFLLGIASVGTLVLPEQNQTLGTAVTGTDAAAADVTVSVAPGTGASTPAAYVIRVPTRGSSGSTVQAVSEAFRVQEVANNGSREVAAWNASGPVMGGIPLNLSAALHIAGTYGRFADNVDIIRAGSGSTSATLRGVTVRGSLDNPTATKNQDRLFTLSAAGFDGTSRRSTAQNFFRATEDWTTTALGTEFVVGIVQNGTTSIVGAFTARGGGSNIAELVSGQNTLRLIPGSTGIAVRDSTNVSDTFSINGAGTTVLFPVATAFVVGADLGSSGLVRIGGQVDVSGLRLVSSTQISRNITSGTLTLSGGSGTTVGGNVTVYGQSHATQANDIEFRSGSTVKGWWDDSAALWTFDADHAIGATNAYYLGAPTTNGTWRIIRSGDELVFQCRETGTYVTKYTITA